MVSGSNMEDVFLPSILVGREKEGGMKGGKKERLLIKQVLGEGPV